MNIAKLLSKDWDIALLYMKDAPPLCIDKDTEIVCEDNILMVVDPNAPNPAKIIATDPDRVDVEKHIHIDSIVCIDYIKIPKIIAKKKLIIT